MRGWWLGLVGLVATAAHATIILPMRDETLVARSDLVVVGTVAHVEAALLAGPRLVTRVTLAVEETLKGAGAAMLVVTEPGGTVGGLRAVVAGAPTYTTGERVLAFLRRRADGSLGTTQLGLGKYRVEAELDGTVLARRRGAVRDDRRLDELAARVRSLAMGAPALAADGRAGAGVEAARATAVVDKFTLITDDAGVGARWFEPDCGFPVPVAQAGTAGDFPDASSADAIAAGIGVWNAVATSTALLAAGAPVAPGPSVLGGTIDGLNTIGFDDPFGEVEDFDNPGPNECSGVLAVTQFLASADSTFVELTRTIDGQRYGKIVEADVVLNPGLAACTNDNEVLAEIVGHEVGHVIGLGHSSEDPFESDPLLEQALMYFAIHADGRGAVVNPDDVAGASAVYPTSLLPLDAVDQAACQARLGILDVSCFEVSSFPAAPFRRYAKAFKAAGRAAAATKPRKQKKQLKKTAHLLAVAGKAAEAVPGPCGLAMRARLRSYGDAVASVLATL